MELDSEDQLLLVSILVLKSRIRRQLLTKPKKKRSVWVKEIFKNRELYGDYHILLQNMMLADKKTFLGKAFFRLVFLIYSSKNI